jgi:hypothetical protein
VSGGVVSVLLIAQLSSTPSSPVARALLARSESRAFTRIAGAARD